MIDAIGIVSSDPKKTIAFYKLLGVNFSRFEGTEHYEATVSSSGLRLLMDTEEGIRQFHYTFKRVRGNGMSLCFKFAGPVDVDRLYYACIKAGGSSIREPWDAVWRQRYCCVADPDGNQVDIFAPL